MKQYLFRGKSVSTGKWVYGSLIRAGSYCCILEDEDKVHPMDYPYLDPDLGVIDGQATPVIPETVGRCVNDPCYTDFTDQRYFEGDIIELHSAKWKSFEKCLGIVIDEHCYTENGLGRCFPQDTLQAKVVGNVWDNPELVGEKYADQYKYYHGFEG
jgi:hypothetical protein